MGKSIDRDACIFPFHTVFSNLDERILELKGTLEIIYSTPSFLHMEKQNGEAICLQPQLVVAEDGGGPQPPLPCLAVCVLVGQGATGIWAGMNFK